MLGLPLQRNWTVLILFDCLKDLQRFGRVAAPCRDLSLDKQGVEFVRMIVTFMGDLERPVRIVGGLVQVAGLQRQSRQHAQSVEHVFLAIFRL